MPRRINLVPRSERTRTATNFGALALIAGAVLVVFALGLSYYLLSSSRTSLQDKYSDLQERRVTLEAQVNALNEYKVLETQRKTTEAMVTSVYAGRTLVSKVLDDLSRVVPENVWFTALSLGVADPAAGLGAEVQGADAGSSFSVQGNTYGFPNVALLLVRLELVEALREINLGNAGDPVGVVDPAKKDVKGFSISALIVNTQDKDAQLPVTKVEVEAP